MLHISVYIWFISNRSIGSCKLVKKDVKMDKFNIDKFKKYIQKVN